MGKGTLWIIQTKTITSDANILATTSQTINSDTFLGYFQTKTIASDAVVTKIGHVNDVYVDVDSSNTIVYGTIPSHASQNTHIELILNGVIKQSWIDSGFKYYDGAAWQTYPVTGITSTHFGNQWKYEGTTTTTGNLRARGLIKG